MTNQQQQRKDVRDVNTLQWSRRFFRQLKIIFIAQLVTTQMMRYGHLFQVAVVLTHPPSIKRLLTFEGSSWPSTRSELLLSTSPSP